MNATMADVAAQVGVSVSTVSLALNGKRGISDRVRALVLQAASELGYVLPARQSPTSSHDAKSIAVVHFRSRRDDDTGLSGHAAAYVKGIQEFCQGQNINWALFANYREGDLHHVGYQLLERSQFTFDGLIVIAPWKRDHGVIVQALKAGVPVVVMSRDWPDLPVSWVGQDHLQQAQLAVDHLVTLGHRHIALLTNECLEPYDWFRVRLDYYREVMRGLGTYDPQLVCIEPDVRLAVYGVLARRPDLTAIFCLDYPSSLQAMLSLADLGVRVPEQVSVASVGDTGETLDGHPGITTVGYPTQKMGYLAARTVQEQIYDPELARCQITVQSWLIERESCVPPREGGMLDSLLTRKDALASVADD